MSANQLLSTDHDNDSQQIVATVKKLTILQVTASRFFGGPERQMLELATAMSDEVETVFLSFSEDGLCQDFLQRARDAGFNAIELESDAPNVFSAGSELANKAEQLGADVVFCEGYKPDIVGLLAKRRMNIPVASISRGWTRENWKVRIYESLGKLALRGLDHVVCVSQEQANRVHATGVPDRKTTVIRNAVRANRFEHGKDKEIRSSLLQMFPTQPRLLVGAAGRLSPEKGFEVLVDAVNKLPTELRDVGFLIFGDGALREPLAQQIRGNQLSSQVVLAGFRDDLDYVIPNLDLFVLSSYTEGLPNVVLEALAASVPVVATSVGGTPEVLEHGKQGYLVGPGNADELAKTMSSLLLDVSKRQEMAAAGRTHVDANFSFQAQANAYLALIEQLKAKHG